MVIDYTLENSKNNNYFMNKGVGEYGPRHIYYDFEDSYYLVLTIDSV